jgi:hypothetical protein
VLLFNHFLNQVKHLYDNCCVRLARGDTICSKDCKVFKQLESSLLSSFRCNVEEACAKHSLGSAIYAWTLLGILGGHKPSDLNDSCNMKEQLLAIDCIQCTNAGGTIDCSVIFQ